jgi:hypothetical protein
LFTVKNKCKTGGTPKLIFGQLKPHQRQQIDFRDYTPKSLQMVFHIPPLRGRPQHFSTWYLQTNSTLLVGNKDALLLPQGDLVHIVSYNIPGKLDLMKNTGFERQRKKGKNELFSATLYSLSLRFFTWDTMVADFAAGDCEGGRDEISASSFSNCSLSMAFLL